MKQDKDLPPDPFTLVKEGFVAMHELFRNLRDGGFTIREAAAIIAAVITAQDSGDNNL